MAACVFVHFSLFALVLFLQTVIAIGNRGIGRNGVVFRFY